MNIQKRRTLLKTRKEFCPMKKNTLEAIRNYLNGDETIDLSVVRDEVNAEWERLNAKRNANRVAYDAAKDVAFGILSETPMTVKEIFAASDEWPQSFTAAKVQYALLNYWNGEVVKHDNGKSAYTYTVRA